MSCLQLMETVFAGRKILDRFSSYILGSMSRIVSGRVDVGVVRKLTWQY